MSALAFGAGAQTLDITNGVHTFGALTNTTVTMTGQCELRITGTNAPIPGSLIHLNSSNAWLFFTGIKPSVVVSAHLSQVRVSGAAGVADSNVRVVQYGPGAVVIPHPPSFRPLQAFSGPHFNGASAQYSQYVYYTGTGLGAMDMNISSFKLKRGYMAVLAQNTGGSGVSQCYVAQDGDLEVGLLPASLDNRVRFIYVTPWRWVSKKGFGETGAGLVAGQNLDVDWSYSWDINQNSTRDREYVGIRQTRYWPGLGQSWQTRAVNTLLGYNEPDNPTQDAYMTVGDAIWSWPDLLGTGLRVGSPAVTDGGRSSWLYPFIEQADAAGLRVDFVAVHYYWCYDPANPSGAATQMYNFLKATYDQVKRPLWITEWNQGANWTGCGDPTYAQQQAAVSAMVDMLESTPFVERYAFYNWVEDVRRVAWDDGSLTDAGVAYRDKVSALSYRQALPDNGGPSRAQLLFENNTLDSSGSANHGLAAGAPVYAAGHNGQGMVLDGTNHSVQLPPNVASGANFSFAAWMNWSGGANWQRLFDFGNDTTHYLFLTPGSGSGTLRFVIRNGGTEQILETAGLPAGQWQHLAVTLGGGTAKIYTNGLLAASSGSVTLTPSSFSPKFNYLGKSQFPADPLFNGSLDEVLIADYVLTGAQVAALQTNQPPQFAASLFSRGTAAPYQAFATNLTGTATDPDAGDTLAYSKAAGLDWLTINADGTMTGTPGSNDGGTNYFTVRVTDAAGASAFATMTIYVPIYTGNGVWTNNASGDWGAATNWSGGNVANGVGYTADFSAVNITADRTVTLEVARSLGALKFGDASGAQNWTLTSSSDPLTLDTGTTTSPGIVVTNTATIAAPLDGANGFTKSGPGTLILSAANPLSGTVNVDSGSTTTSDGVVRAAHPAALSSVTDLAIRNNNGGTSTLQLNGASGDLTTPAPIALSGRNINLAAIQNLSGSNTLSGAITLNSGGGYYVFQSDAGTLHLGGAIAPAVTTLRVLTFQGAGNFLVSGSIQNGTATNHLTKTGSGTLTLSGANTHSGTNRIVAGTLLLANSAALQNSLLDLYALDAGTLSFGSLTAATLGGLTGSRALSLMNTAAAPVTLTFGGNNQSLAYSGALTGSGGIVKTGSGTQTLSGASTFAGSARVTGGTLLLANGSALLNSTLSLENGALSFGALTSANLGGLGGSANLGLTNASGAAVALTVGNNGQPSGYAGILSGPGSLVKTGAGTLSLSRASTYAGTTTVNAGTLKLSRDPIVKLTFDSVGGTAAGSAVTNDGTGGSVLNGTVVNGATGVNFVSGKVGNALSLSGDGSCVRIPGRVTSLDGKTTGADWTLAMWLKTTQAGAGYAYQGDGGWASGNTAFYLNQGNSTAGTRVGAVRWGGGWLTGSASVNNGAWRFIAITAANGTKSIYIDGNLDSTVTAWTNVSVGNQFWIGGTGDSGDGVARMNGQLDEVSVFNRALTIAEVRSLTNAAVMLTGTYGGQLPNSTALAVSSGATFDLGGNFQTVASLADGAGGGSVTNSGAAAVTLTLGSSSGTRTFSGVIADGASSGAISLIKNGGASAILSGANRIRGATTVNAGSLLVHGSLGTGSVAVNGGTLGGNGVLGGPVTVQSGGTLSPGASVGTLAISNALALAGTTVIELDQAGLTNDLVCGMSSVTFDGALVVTNLGADPALGASFKLFDAAAYYGSFATVTLPSLGAGLAWDVSGLTNGVLSVVVGPPQIASYAVGTGDFRITGLGVAGIGYSLEGATNLAPPVFWDFITNATADGSGSFLLVDPAATNHPQRYYRVRYP